MKIMIVDQCDLDREQMLHLLKCQPDLEIVGDGNTGKQMIEQARSNQPDIVLMGSNLFASGGREMMRLILSECPETAFIILAPGDNIELLLEALGNGARGYLRKNVSEAVLLRSLYGVERGELALSRSMMATLVSELRKILQAILANEDNSISTLTRKERQILRLLATEASNQDIARQLPVSDNSVRAHVSYS